MDIIFMLLAISVSVAVVFFFAFIRSVKKGQYDDTYTPSIRILFDDAPTSSKDTENSKHKATLLEDQSL